MKLFWSKRKWANFFINSILSEETLIKSNILNDAMSKKLRDYFLDLDYRIQILENSNDFKMFESKIQQLERRIGALKSDIEFQKKPIIQNDHAQEIQQCISTQSIIKYPAALTKSGFPSNLFDTQGDRYFRFFNFKNDTADFDFCGNDFERAKVNKIELEQACEISGSMVDAHKIINIEKGSVALQDFKWVITRKAKIKFE